MLGLLLFWTAITVLAYQYVGYPLALAGLARWRGRGDALVAEESRSSETPSASLVISAYDEEEVIARKLENALLLDYPRELLEIVVASDGSKDRTEEITRRFADRGVVLHAFRPNRGKNLVLNDVLPLLKGDVVVFTDANGMYQKDAIRHLVRPFADPRVGSVCGELVYKNFNENPIAEGYNRYWELDQMQKRLESRLGSLLGANGSIFAVRRSLCRPIANDVCNDMVQPIWVAAAGHLCLYEPRAMSYEAGSRNLNDELKRRSRIIGRGIRGIQLVWPEIARRRARLIGWELFSRKGLRYLTPLWLAMLLNKKLPFQSFVRAVVLLPFIVPTALSALAFWWLYDAQFSVLSWALVKMGLIDSYISFLGDPWMARFSTIAANIWRGVPFVAITLLAGLQTISPSLYEAASLDGATEWQRFWHVTLPLLTPIIAVVMTFSVLFTFTDFQLIYVLTRGGPLNATHLMATLSFQRAILGGALGEGAALATAMVPFLLAAIMFSYFGLQRRAWQQGGSDK